MKRLLVVGVTALTLAWLTIASAAYLAVEGGVLQAFTQQITPPPPPSPTPASCTHTPDYYRNQTESWPADQLSLGGATYPQPLLLAILNMPAIGDVNVGVAQAMIAAKLNVARGVDSVAIRMMLTQADAWLAAHPVGSSTAQQDWQVGVTLLRQLEQVNNGAAGYGLCPGDEVQQIAVRPTPTLTPSPTITPTVTATVEPTATWTPAATALPTPEVAVLNFAVVWQDALGSPLHTRPAVPETFAIDVTSDGRAAQCRYFEQEEPLRCSFVYYDAEGRADGLWLQGGAPYTVAASVVPEPFAAVAGLGDFVAGAEGCNGAACLHTVTFRENAPPPTPTPEETPTALPTATLTATATITVTATPVVTTTATPQVTATATPSATATQPASGAEVQPRLQCVLPLDDERHVAFFDYDYESADPRIIEAGPENFLSSAKAEGTVPTLFARHRADEWPDHRLAAIFEGPRLTWTVQGRSAHATPDSPACAQMLGLTVIWMRQTVGSWAPPADVAAEIVISLESDLGTAECRVEGQGEQDVACRFENELPDPLPLDGGLWVAAGERYRVSVEGLEAPYRALGTGVFELDDLACDDDPAQSCAHRVTLMETGSGRGTPTPRPTPTATSTREAPTATPTASGTPAPTPSSTPQPTATGAPPSPTPELTPPATATATAAATPTPTATPSPTVTAPPATPSPTPTPPPTATWTPPPPTLPPPPTATPTAAPEPTLPPTQEPTAAPPDATGEP